MVVDWNDHDYITGVLDNHFMEIINAIRGGARTELISSWYHIPQWMVQRLGTDMKLTEDEDGVWRA